MFSLVSLALLVYYRKYLNKSNLLGIDILSNTKVLTDKWSKRVEMEEWQFSSSHKITWKMEVVISRENYSINNGVKSV